MTTDTAAYNDGAFEMRVSTEGVLLAWGPGGRKSLATQRRNSLVRILEF